MKVAEVARATRRRWPIYWDEPHAMNYHRPHRRLKPSVRPRRRISGSASSRCRMSRRSPPRVCSTSAGVTASRSNCAASRRGRPCATSCFPAKSMPRTRSTGSCTACSSGIGGPQADMAVLMVLNRNGGAITLSNALADAWRDTGSLKDAFASLGRAPVLAQTFPTGTHAMWLYYWLAAHGVHPLRDIESVVIPPPRMVDALAEDQLDGFCCGEPWHALAEARGAGRTVALTSGIWPDHPGEGAREPARFRRAVSEHVARAGPDDARSVPLARRARASRGDRGAARRARTAQRAARADRAAPDRRLRCGALSGRAARQLLRRRHGQLPARVRWPVVPHAIPSLGHARRCVRRRRRDRRRDQPDDSVPRGGGARRGAAAERASIRRSSATAARGTAARRTPISPDSTCAPEQA